MLFSISTYRYYQLWMSSLYFMNIFYKTVERVLIVVWGYLANKGDSFIKIAEYLVT